MTVSCLRAFLAVAQFTNMSEGMGCAYHVFESRDFVQCLPSVDFAFVCTNFQ